MSPIQPSSVIKTFTTFDYVQDGFIFCLDAIENAGRLQHDSTANNTWTDVISNTQYVTYKGANERSEIHSNFYQLTTSGGFRGYLGELANAINAGAFTVEAVCKYDWIVSAPNSVQRIYIANRYGSDPGFDFVRYSEIARPQVYTDGMYVFNVSFGNPIKALPVPGEPMSHCAYVFDVTGKTAYGYHNGAFNNTCTFNPQTVTYRTQAIQIWFGTDQTQAAFQTTGKVCAIRAYSKMLSAEELHHNYLIDKVRFGVR